MLAKHNPPRGMSHTWVYWIESPGLTGQYLDLYRNAARRACWTRFSNRQTTSRAAPDIRAAQDANMEWRITFADGASRERIPKRVQLYVRAIPARLLRRDAMNRSRPPPPKPFRQAQCLQRLNYTIGRLQLIARRYRKVPCSRAFWTPVDWPKSMAGANSPSIR